MTLTEFLLARLAEGEARIRSPYARSPVGKAALRGANDAGARLLDVLEERIEVRRASAAGEELTLCDLAAVYADHPDYRDEMEALAHNAKKRPRPVMVGGVLAFLARDRPEANQDGWLEEKTTWRWTCSQPAARTRSRRGQPTGQPPRR